MPQSLPAFPLEVACIHTSAPLLSLVSLLSTCRFLLTAIEMLVLRGRFSPSSLRGLVMSPRLDRTLRRVGTPGRTWETPPELQWVRALQGRPAARTVLRSEISLGHLGEAAWARGKDAGFGG